MKKAPSPDTLRTHQPAWRGCGSLVDLPNWPTGGVCGEVGVICNDCHEGEDTFSVEGVVDVLAGVVDVLAGDLDTVYVGQTSIVRVLRRFAGRRVRVSARVI